MFGNGTHAPQSAVYQKCPLGALLSGMILIAELGMAPEGDKVCFAIHPHTLPQLQDPQTSGSQLGSSPAPKLPHDLQD